MKKMYPNSFNGVADGGGGTRRRTFPVLRRLLALPSALPILCLLLVQAAQRGVTDDVVRDDGNDVVGLQRPPGEDVEGTTVVAGVEDVDGGDGEADPIKADTSIGSDGGAGEDDVTAAPQQPPAAAAVADTAPATTNRTLKIGVILPFSGGYPWTLTKSRPAIEYAVETVLGRPDLLAGWRIVVTYGDSQCSEVHGPLVAIDMYLNRSADVFLGPACDYSVAPIARFSPHWNIPVITGGALVQAFLDKTQYRLLTRMTGSYAKLGESVGRLFAAYNWTVGALLYHNNLGRRQSLGKSNCFFVMEATYANLYPTYRRRFPTGDFYNKAFDETAADLNITDLLKDASKEARSKS